MLDDPLMVSGPLRAVPDGLWLVLDDFAAQVERQEVDEERHAELVDDILVSSVNMTRGIWGLSSDRSAGLVHEPH